MFLKQSKNVGKIKSSVLRLEIIKFVLCFLNFKNTSPLENINILKNTIKAIYFIDLKTL